MSNQPGIVDAFAVQRSKQNLVTRLTGASDVGQDDQRIGCSICGFPGHSSQNCYNLIRLNTDKGGQKNAKLLELSSTSSEDDDDELIKQLKLKKIVLDKIERGLDLTKEEEKFLRKDQIKEPEKKKKKKRRKRKSSSSSESDSADEDEGKSEAKIYTRKAKRKKKSKKKRKHSDDERDSSKDKNCGVCLIEKCKYRCPHCRILYCVGDNGDFTCFKEHKENKLCETRIEKGLNIKPATKEDGMDMKEKLALALKKRRKIRKMVQ